jgi:hypothetical protein
MHIILVNAEKNVQQLNGSDTDSVESKAFNTVNLGFYNNKIISKNFIYFDDAGNY